MEWLLDPAHRAIGVIGIALALLVRPSFERVKGTLIAAAFLLLGLLHPGLALIGIAFAVNTYLGGILKWMPELFSRTRD